MTRRIRNPRARELQGSRAGIVSRAIASSIDVGIGVAIYAVIVAAFGFVWDLLFSDRFGARTPPALLSVFSTWFVIVVYLTVGWGSTGRSIGKQIMGLRVVRADAGPLRPAQALGRAVLCASFYPGLVVAAVQRRNRALEDIVFRTVVVYDWIPETARSEPEPRRGVAPAAATGGSGQQPA